MSSQPLGTSQRRVLDLLEQRGAMTTDEILDAAPSIGNNVAAVVDSLYRRGLIGDAPRDGSFDLLTAYRRVREAVAQISSV